MSDVVDRLTRLPLVVITTHCHWDHIGGHGEFDVLAIHQEDRGWLENGLPISTTEIVANLLKEPFSRKLPRYFNPDNYHPFVGRPQHVLHDNDVIDLGDRQLKIIHTPGHSPGHICVFEEETGYLCTGDLLYDGTLYANYPSTDPCKLHDSIRRIDSIEHVSRLLAGHRRLDIPRSFLSKAHLALDKLADAGFVRHGTGVYECGDIRYIF
jgi:glyoxylase-like metal-dependent hydrolase (beta-lactamase superfamily II)